MATTEATGRKTRGWMSRIAIGRNPRNTLVRIIVLVVVCFVVFKFVLLPIRIEGPSMLPTYQERGINFVNRLAYLRSDPQRGDVVGIQLAGPHIMFMKRIVGLPGETVAFHDGRVVINGVPLDEPYVKLPSNWEAAPIVLKPGEYYVVGDNRSMPKELHEEGPAERRRIVGKVLLCKNLFVSWLR